MFTKILRTFLAAAIVISSRDMIAFIKMHLDAFRNMDMQSNADLLARAFMAIIILALGIFFLLNDRLILFADIKRILYKSRKLMEWKALHENSPNR